MKGFRIPTIIAVILLMLAVGAGVFLVQNQQLFRIGASPDIAPQDVRISNISDTSLSVSWTTDKATAGSLKWGETAGQINKVQPGDETAGQNVHLVTLSGLSPEKNYYFKISSDGTDYDNSGIPWQTATGAALEPSANSKVISGTVMTATGEPAAGALVYLTGTGIATLSTKTTSSGSFLIPLGSLRNSGLTAYADLSSNPVLQLYVQAGPSGISSAQFLPTLTSLPTMVLGKTYDLRNQSDQAGSEVGGVNLNIPEQSAPVSKFDINNATASPAPSKTVTLKSIDNGETLTTTKPELIGEGPVGVKITITIRSTAPITGTATVSSNGTWKWDPPANLAPGEHTVTISWKDAAGALQTLTRTFVVSAAEGPAFVATPSASPSSLITFPSSSPSAKPSPRVTIPSTESGIPKTGTGGPTIILAGLGLFFITTSVYVTIKYAN